MGLTQRRKGAKAETRSFLCFLRAFAPLREISLAIVAIAALFSVHGNGLADDQPRPAEGRDDSALYAVDTVLDKLDNPASVAVRPGSRPAGPFDLYVSESGAGRVVRLTTDKPGEASSVVSGFPTSQFGPEGQYRVGPLGLAFLSRNRLAVGTGGLGVGADLVRVYGLPENNADLAFDAVDHVVGPVPTGGRTTTGEGQFASLARTENALFVVPRTGDERGWILKAILDSNRVAGLEPFVATRAIAGVATPAAVAVDPKPNHHYLVVGQMGETSAATDSRLTMYSPTSGALALNLATGLRDVVGLAFSPAGDLYAVDFAWADAAEGGVFRLEAAQVEGRESCRPVKIATVARPASLAFTPDGTLYVTAFGAGDAPTGALLKITPRPETPPL